MTLLPQTRICSEFIVSNFLKYLTEISNSRQKLPRLFTYWWYYSKLCCFLHDSFVLIIMVMMPWLSALGILLKLLPFSKPPGARENGVGSNVFCSTVYINAYVKGEGSRRPMTYKKLTQLKFIYDFHYSILPLGLRIRSQFICQVGHIFHFHQSLLLLISWSGS